MPENHLEQAMKEMEKEIFGEPITIGTPEEAARVAQSLTDEDIERLEREEMNKCPNTF